MSGDFSWNARRTFTYVAELVGFISAPQRSHTRFVAILLALLRLDIHVYRELGVELDQIMVRVGVRAGDVLDHV